MKKCGRCNYRWSCLCVDKITWRQFLFIREMFEREKWED